MWASYAAMRASWTSNLVCSSSFCFSCFWSLMPPPRASSSQYCDVVNGTVRDQKTTIPGENPRLSKAHVHDHVQRIGRGASALQSTEWFLSSTSSEIAHRGRMTLAQWKFAVAARPLQVSEHLMFIFAESGKWHSACAEQRAPSSRRLRLRHSDPWNVIQRRHRPSCTSVHDGVNVSQCVPRGTQSMF